MILNSYELNQIKAQVGAIQKKHPQDRIIAIQATSNGNAAVNGNGESSLFDDSEISIDGRKYKIYHCRSVLQIREVLANSDTANEFLLIITEVETKNLEHDLTARLARRRIFSLDPWEILRELFQSRDVSPQLQKQKWIAKFLLDDIPLNGYPATPSGILDEETVWKIILVDKIGMRSARPDIQDLLIWSLEIENLESFRALPEEFQTGVRERIKKSAGAIALLIFSAIKEGCGNLLISLGLVCEIISDGQDIKEIAQSAVRIERYFSNQPLSPEILSEFAKAAVSVVNSLTEAQSAKLYQIFSRAQEILREIHLADYAHLSASLPAGFEARLANYGRELTSLTEAKVLKISAELRELFNEVRHHKLSLQQDDRLKKVEMSLRLLNWLIAVSPAEFSGFAGAAAFYVQETSYADWARNVILHGDSNEIFASGLTGLQKLVTQKREKQNEVFGELLVRWTESGSAGDEVWRVEDVLKEVAAVTGTQKRVLLIVMDGMSYAAFREIKEDLKQNGWQSFAPKDESIKPVIAALPSVTAVSRTSLLSGKLLRGNSATESKEFAKNQNLAAISKTGHPPKLFHKSSIAEGIGAALTRELTESLHSEDQKVIGVVVNSIDDHLAKGEQLAVSWNLRTVPLLNKLLATATETDRLIVITSDHGHIIEQEGVFQKEDFAGERYRESGQVKAGELSVSGSRVLGQNGNTIIAPWSESVRYAKKKHGYHGGISPQECVIPLTVVSRSSQPVKNWEKEKAAFPNWWTLDEKIITKKNPIKPLPEKKKQSDELIETLPLFQ